MYSDEELKINQQASKNKKNNEKTNYKKINNKTSNKKNILISIGLVTLIMIVGLSIFWINNNRQTNDNTTNNNNNNYSVNENINIIDVNSHTRPYAVMINCHNSALPQAGLDKAYLVYEIMIEGGITRMMALYKDIDVNKIGSVRSARDQYLAYVFENDAIYVHAGGQLETLERIKNEKIADVDVDGKYGVRDRTLKRAWEHTLFTNTNLLRKAVTNTKLRTTTTVNNLLDYTSQEIDPTTYKGNKRANHVSIKYSNYRTANYTYDNNTKTYLRSMNNTKNTDLVTKEQYRVKNIIVYGVKSTTYTAHGYTGYQRISNIGTGDGLYITNGYAIPITWEKKDEQSQTVYKVKNTGKELVVNDGNTYIQIYPTSGKLTIK